MALAPFHLGPALLAGVVPYRFLDLPTVLAGSVVVDVRAALVVFGPLDGPVHGVLTTFVGATAVAVGSNGRSRSVPIRENARDGIRTHGPLRERVLSPPPLARLGYPRASWTTDGRWVGAFGLWAATVGGREPSIETAERPHGTDHSVSR